MIYLTKETIESVEKWETEQIIENSLRKYAGLHHFGNKVPSRWYLQFSLLWIIQDPTNQDFPIAYKNG